MGSIPITRLFYVPERAGKETAAGKEACVNDMTLQFCLNSILLGVGLAMDAFSVSCANALREPKMKLPRMAVIAGVYAFFQFLMPVTGWLCVHTIEEHFVAIQDFIPWIALALLTWIGGNMLVEGIREGRSSASSGSRTVQSTSQQEQPAQSAFQQELPDQEQPAQSASQQELPDQEQPAQSASQQKQLHEDCGERTQGKAPVNENAGRLTVSVLLLQGIATSIDALSTGFTIASYDWRMALTACLIIAAVTFAICMGGLEIGKKAGVKLTGKADILGGIILIAIGLEIVITHYFLP